MGETLCYIFNALVMWNVWLAGPHWGALIGRTVAAHQSPSGGMDNKQRGQRSNADSCRRF